MRLTKQQREALRAKFDGRCAYCGDPLGARWHADHIEAVERKLEFVRDGYSARLRTTGEVHRPERDTIENLNPACAPCNIDKHAMSLEGWRRKLQNAPGVLTRNQPTYRHALRFGLVQETGAAVVFYFERARGVEASVPECETCRGEGTIDERLGGYSFSNPAAECPDCGGTGEGPHGVTTVSTAGGCNPEEARTNAGATPSAPASSAAGNLPGRRELPKVDASYGSNSTYFRALGWNECLDEISRRNAGGMGKDRS